MCIYSACVHAYVHMCVHGVHICIYTHVWFTLCVCVRVRVCVHAHVCAHVTRVM